MGATSRCGSDCYPYTIVRMSKNKGKIYLQEDKAFRLDNNGFSDIQEYRYEPNLVGGISPAYRHKDGHYYFQGSKTKITLDFRRRFFDYCF